MARKQEKNRSEIQLGGDFRGVTLARTDNGGLVVDVDTAEFGSRNIILRTDGNGITLQAATEKQANSAAATVTQQAYQIGDVLLDGWVVGPVSPDTGLSMSIEPLSGALNGSQIWDQGEDHAAMLRGKGNLNARQPSINELVTLDRQVVIASRNDNAKLDTTFKKIWSGTTNPNNGNEALCKSFLSNFRGSYHKRMSEPLSRCVRDEPGITLK